MARKRFELPGIFKNALILFSGSSVAQLIALALTPVLSRIYTPDDFGVFALFVGISGFFSIISTLRYELAIMLPKEQEGASAIVKLCFIIVLIVSALSLLVVSVAGDLLTDMLGNKQVLPWLWMVPLVVLFTGIYQILNYWNTRHSAFKRVATARITQSAVTGAGQLGFMKMVSAGGLIAGFVAGFLGGSINLWIRTPSEERKSWFKASAASMKELARKYKDFPKFNALQALVDSLQSSGVIFLISSFFGSMILGWYSFTFRILQAPLGLIGSSVAQAFYQQASLNYNNGESMQKLFKSSFRSLVLLAMPVFLVLAIFAPLLFSWIFGENWQEAGVYAQYMVPWLFMNFLVSPFSQLPMIVGEQKKMMLFSLVGNLLILSSLLAGAYFDSIKIGFIFLSATQFIYLGLILIWYYKLSAKHNMI